MKLAVFGAGYLGLVTNVYLDEIGYHVVCIDKDKTKVDTMRKGIPSIYETGLSELMTQNIKSNRLSFITNYNEEFENADVIYIEVGTRKNLDGSTNLKFVEEIATTIGQTAKKDTIVVTKRNVPVGTNNRLQQLIDQKKLYHIKIEVKSNPEFSKEESSIYDSFHGNCIVIEANSGYAANIIEETFGIPIYKTDLRSAEMIKYASNAFLVTKFSFINKIANICEIVGAEIEQVAVDIGLDNRIAIEYLKEGLGFGGSCFPKDKKALIQISGNVQYDFELLKGVVNVNKKQRRKLLVKVYKHLIDVNDKIRVILGLTFKPNNKMQRYKSKYDSNGRSVFKPIKSKIKWVN